MALFSRAGLSLAAMGSATIAHAQVEVAPDIVVLETERQVQTNIRADGTIIFSESAVIAVGSFEDDVSDELGGESGSSGSATAQQDTLISRFTVRGSGQVNASAELGGDEQASISADANSEVFVRFTIPVDAPYSLTGTLDASGSLAGSTAAFAGFSPTGVFFHGAGYSPGDPPEDRDFMFIGTAAANQEQNFSVGISAGPFGDRDPKLTFGLGDAAASFNFNLDFGDRDGDGLLDVWEEEGIDFDGVEPPDIDLPAMGADPDVKDIFVELDVMAGVALDQSAIDQVIAAFARAPAMAVRNNDGSAGIRLHVRIDGDRPARTALIGTNLEEMPPQFYDLKNEFFGSDLDRNHPDWLAIRDAKMQIFRYCLWADTIAFDVTGFPNPIQALGFAEGIPSNDFALAAGDIVASYSDYVTEKQAGNFMHELGHTLGLRHGGQDEENHKPNYLSVMNYMYAMPFSRTTPQNTNVGDYWELDYSRSVMTGLDETALNETQGLGGPPGRKIYFNSAAAADNPPVLRGVALAHLPYVDWNANGNQTEGPYDQDITRIDPAAILALDESLRSYSDWNRIWYQLAGTADFDDRALLPNAQPSPALLKAELEAFHNVDWVDLVVLDDGIFSNDFERAPDGRR